MSLPVSWTTVKVVIVGDGAVGKTSMVLKYVNDDFPGEYIPYVCEPCIKHRMIDEKPFTLELWDTPAQDGYDRLRPTCYSEKDMFLICFSLVSPISLESVTKKWYPEVREHCPLTPIFLVGTKLDLRTDEETVEILKSHDMSPITTPKGLEMKETIGACRYIECSSLTGENLDSLFDEVLRVVLVTAKHNKRKCLIL